MIDKEFYNRNGYILLEENLLEGIDTEVLDNYVNERASREGRFQDAWQGCTQVRDLARHPRILEILKELYEREPIPFQTLNFVVGTEQRTHSDTIHFSSANEQGLMCGVWIALEDIGLNQGPLHYWEGSNLLPVEDYETLGIGEPIASPSWSDPYTGEIYGRYEQELYSRLRSADCKYKELPIKKGNAFIWSANLAHGGSKILERGSSRRSQVTHYYFDGVVPVTNMASVRSRGEFYIRNPINIRTGLPMDITWDGKPITYEHVPGTSRYKIRVIDEIEYSQERAQEYLNRYADIRSSYPSPEAAFKHYTMFGISEGRIY